MTAFDLTDSIHGIHHRLVAQLRERRHLPHNGLKGDEGELLWLRLLEQHLPHRYAVRRGIVIDSRGARSDAIDLIIYDPQYTPVFLAQDQHAYVFAEAVYAVFEVKQEVDAENIRYAAAKAASVRRLHRTSTEIMTAGGPLPPRPPIPILAGLLTLGHSWTTDPAPLIREHLGKYTDQSQIDIILSLESIGLVEQFPGDAGPTFDAGPSSLVLFLYRLLHRLQQCATVPAIDWPAYIAALRAPPV